MSEAQEKIETIIEDALTKIRVEKPEPLTLLQMRELRIKDARKLLLGYLMASHPGKASETPDWVNNLYEAVDVLDRYAEIGINYLKNKDK